MRRMRQNRTGLARSGMTGIPLAGIALCVAALAIHSPPAAASTDAVPPLILMPVPEAPHGIPRGHVAAKQRHETKLASAQHATAAAIAALPLVDRQFVASHLEEGLQAAVAADTADQDLTEVLHFYQERGFRPAWTDSGQVTLAAKQTIERLSRAHLDGLDPADYDVDASGGLLRFGSIAALVDFEIAMSTALSRYVRHAAMGRIAPGSVSRFITIQPERPDVPLALTRIAESAAPAKLLDGLHPQHDGFITLREALALSYASEDDGAEQVHVPAGKLIKPGMRDERIPLLRARLDLADPAGDALLYDKVLADAVVRLQKRHGLPSQGFVGKLTLGVLNGHATGSRSDIIVNMERWRWLPRDLGKHFVKVNVPEYLVRVVSRGEVIHTTRVVVGKVKNQTPIFSDTMEHIVVNPAWNVPRSIATKEYLPRLQQDPTYLSRKNIQVLGRGGRVLDPNEIDWASYSRASMPYRFRQPSGRGNALGNVKFMFPNQHAVYLHDTQARSLFSRSRRAYSHGCVRVHQPFKFADALLRLEPDLSGTGLKRMIGARGERYVHLKTEIPVHLTYFTAIAGADGAVKKLRDVYGHDRRMKQMLGL